MRTQLKFDKYMWNQLNYLYLCRCKASSIFILPQSVSHTKFEIQTKALSTSSLTYTNTPHLLSPLPEQRLLKLPYTIEIFKYKNIQFYLITSSIIHPPFLGNRYLLDGWRKAY